MPRAKISTVNKERLTVAIDREERRKSEAKEGQKRNEENKNEEKRNEENLCRRKVGLCASSYLCA